MNADAASELTSDAWYRSVFFRSTLLGVVVAAIAKFWLISKLVDNQKEKQRVTEAVPMHGSWSAAPGGDEERKLDSLLLHDEPIAELHTIDDLYALSNPAGDTVTHLRIRLALQNATREQVARWLDEKPTNSNGSNLAQTLKAGPVLSELYRCALQMDPMILVERLEGKPFPQRLGGLPSLPSDQLGKLMQHLPDRYRVRLMATHLRTLETAELKEEFLKKHASDKERTGVAETERSEAVLAARIPEDLESAERHIGNLSPDEQAVAWRQYYWRALREPGTRPEEMLGKMRQLGVSDRDVEVQEQVYASAGIFWLRSDPDGAFQWARNLDEQVLPGVLQSMIGDMSRTDPRVARQVFEALPPQLQTKDGVRQISSELARIDPEAATKWHWEQPANLRDEASPPIEAWISRDPSAAMEWLSANPEAIGDGVRIGTALYKHDPDQAIEFVESLPPSQAKVRTVEWIASRLYSGEFSQSVEFINRQDEGVVKQAAIKYLAGSGYRKDPEGTLEWLSGLDGDDYAVAVSSIISSAAWSNQSEVSEIALNFLNTRTADEWPQEVEQALTRVGAAMVSASTEEAKNWVEKLPLGDAWDAAVVGIADSWTKFAPQDAAEWIAELPAGSARDEAIGYLVNNLPDDPEAAFKWAATISDADERRGTLQGLAFDWRDYDYEAAAAAVERLDLSPAEIQKLRRAISQ